MLPDLHGISIRLGSVGPGKWSLTFFFVCLFLVLVISYSLSFVSGPVCECLSFKLEARVPFRALCKIPRQKLDKQSPQTGA